MTQQSQRPRGHATVVAQAGPSSQTYVHQHQRFTLGEAAASSAGHPLPPLTPATHSLPRGGSHRVLFFFFLFFERQLHVLLGSEGNRCHRRCLGAAAGIPAAAQLGCLRSPPRAGPAFTRSCRSWTFWIA